MRSSAPAPSRPCLLAPSPQPMPDRGPSPTRDPPARACSRRSSAPALSLDPPAQALLRASPHSDPPKRTSAPAPSRSSAPAPTRDPPARVCSGRSSALRVQFLQRHGPHAEGHRTDVKGAQVDQDQRRLEREGREEHEAHDLPRRPCVCDARVPRVSPIRRGKRASGCTYRARAACRTRAGSP